MPTTPKSSSENRRPRRSARNRSPRGAAFPHWGHPHPSQSPARSEINESNKILFHWKVLLVLFLPLSLDKNNSLNFNPLCESQPEYCNFWFPGIHTAIFCFCLQLISVCYVLTRVFHIPQTLVLLNLYHDSTWITLNAHHVDLSNLFESNCCLFLSCVLSLHLLSSAIWLDLNNQDFLDWIWLLEGLQSLRAVSMCTTSSSSSWCPIVIPWLRK